MYQYKSNATKNREILHNYIITHRNKVEKFVSQPQGMSIGKKLIKPLSVATERLKIRPIEKTILKFQKKRISSPKALLALHNILKL